MRRKRILRTVSFSCKYPSYITNSRAVKHRKYRDEHVEFKTQGFSIAGDPITLWARGTYRWIEIFSVSEKFEATHKEMMDGIHVYFTIASIYEKPHSRKKGSKKVSKKIDEILQEVSKKPVFLMVES
jgi:hypothetical protein